MNTKEKIVKLYKKLRTPDYHRANGTGKHYQFQSKASYCLQISRREVEVDEVWSQYVDELVRLVWKPDDDISFDDLCGDMFDPDVNSDVNPRLLEKQEKEFADTIEQEGVWGLVAQVCTCTKCNTWQAVDSVWGFVGQGENGYETDLKVSALKQAGLWGEV